jgi:CheY-like chemotaxis protein
MSQPSLILSVEDEKLVQLVVEDLLKEAGYDVALATSGEEAIRLLEAGPEKFRALVTDIRLGKGPSGWDVARRARELVHDLPVVYLTADSAADWSSMGVPNSVLIMKPFAGGQIVTAVSTLLNDADAHRTT